MDSLLDQQFFSDLSQFKSQDFVESSNPEMLMLKSLIEDGEEIPLEARSYGQQQPQSREHYVNILQSRFAQPDAAPTHFQSLPYGSQERSLQDRHRVYQQAFPNQYYPPQPQQHNFPSGVYYPTYEEQRAAAGQDEPSVSPQGTIKRMKPTRESKAKASKRKAKAESDDDSAATTGDSDSEGNGRHFPASIHGETRLNIKFLSTGEIGALPQKFGKNNCYIPHNLSGTHQMYDQRWQFEVSHEPQNGMVLIRWTIHNLSSGKTTSAVETVQDALNRESCGRTICNNVLKRALETRAQELEETLATSPPTNPRASNMRATIKALRPKRCTVGLLFFGLLHEQIQTRMLEQLAKSSTTKEA